MALKFKPEALFKGGAKAKPAAKKAVSAAKKVPDLPQLLRVCSTPAIQLLSSLCPDGLVCSSSVPLSARWYSSMVFFDYCCMDCSVPSCQQQQH
jgi:hypothetical protein